MRLPMNPLSSVPRILPLLAAALSGFTMFAQPYYPLPDSNATWTVGHGSSDCIFANVPTGIVRYSILGDTMIAGMTYHNVLRTVVVYGCWFTFPGHAGAFRNDTSTRQVFIVPPGSSQEQVLYDFNLAVGDTISAYQGENVAPQDQVVLAIDSVEIQGQYRRRWVFAPGLGDGEDSVIEGVGSKLGIVERYDYVDSKTSLLCFSVGDSMVYEPYPGICGIHYGIDDLASAHGLDINPNPTSGAIQIKYQGAFKQKELVIFDGFGRVAMRLPMTGVETHADLDLLAPGVYAIVLLSEYGTLGYRKLVLE